MSRMLTIPVKGIYFDQIKAGMKPFEYRLKTEYWSKRLVGRMYGRVVLTRGYPKSDDAAHRLELPWRGFEEQTITHPHFGAEPVQVFAIRVDGAKGA
ncbi:RNA-binding protein [Pandoraea cepalis]|uniref:RNA-binding protein n=1 Tax=Pandoraea cepalis TaxID=2508294 RepID=A0AAW7MMA4_9BURK|nr:ASCH domain-containing protein [Pandoraea cepalis]MDN4573716.1 RNA-binding protein [Pandoraea cepalis]MDN4578258.1 RNA-binding protein [Pandoraea cepalis]